MSEYIISPTQMSMFFGCASAWYHRYILGNKTPPGVALLIGTGLHGASEANFSQKISSRMDLTRSDVQDAAVAAFDGRVAADGVYMVKEEAERSSQILGEAKDKTAQMAGVFHQSVAPVIQPIAVEKKITFVRESLPDVVFNGRVDVIDEREDVIDIKTSKNKWPASKAEDELQPTFYLPGAKELGLSPKKFVYHVVTKGKTPQHHVVTTTRDESDMVAVEERARVMVSMIQAGVFPPCEPDHWRCSEKWCGYFMTCKFRSTRDKNKVFSSGTK